jgi:tRNA(fMet)-specific endonuclease VapC
MNESRAVSESASVPPIASPSPLESDIERVYASIRVALERKGTPIGAHDMLIAAHARAIDAVCVTDSVAEFRRVPALKMENWLK